MNAQHLLQLYEINRRLNRYLSREIQVWGGKGLSSGVDEVEAREEDENPAGSFEDDRTLGFFGPAHVALDELGRCTGEDDDGAVAQCVGYQ